MTSLAAEPSCAARSFAASGTTAYGAEQWGRRWITIDTSRVPLALARQRLLTATFPYYEIRFGKSASKAPRDWRTPKASPERGSVLDCNSPLPLSCCRGSNHAASGLVYERKQNARGEEVGGIVPHIPLKRIAHNEAAFCVSQAFFPRTAAWDNLKRELRGVYADSVWVHLAGTVSEPFAAGEHRQIAVKVIDDRGNELLVVKKLSAAEERK